MLEWNKISSCQMLTVVEFAQCFLCWHLAILHGAPTGHWLERGKCILWPKFCIKNDGKPLVNSVISYHNADISLPPLIFHELVHWILYLTIHTWKLVRFWLFSYLRVLPSTCFVCGSCLIYYFLIGVVWSFIFTGLFLRLM